MRRTSAIVIALLAMSALGSPLAIADKDAGRQTAANTVPTDERGLPLRKPAEPKTGLEDIMCHMCEWRPHPFVLPAGAQCGVDAQGDPKEGVFSCGLEKNCEKRCDFVKCQGT
jgi:hypothetical protein